MHLKKSAYVLPQIYSYEKYVNYIVRFFCDTSLENVTTQKVQEFADWMAHGTQHSIKNDLSENSIFRVLGLLKLIMTEAVDVGELIPKFPYKPTLIVNNGLPSTHHKALPPDVFDEVKRRIPTLENPKERIFMALLASTGMRPEEIYGLRWEDISSDWTYLRIVRAVTYPDKNLPVINEPKTKRSNRFINLIEWVADILKTQKKDSGFVLGGEKPLCYVTRSRLQRNAWKHVGLEGKQICPYDFRANFATMLCESGKSDKQVADMMGHADTRMVDTVYAPARKEGILQHKETCESLFGL